MTKKECRFYVLLGLFWVSAVSCMQGTESTSVFKPTSTETGEIVTGSSTLQSLVSVTPAATFIPNPPLNTPESDSETPEFNSSSMPLQQIATEDIQDVWWSDDSNILYYGVLFEGNFAYDIQNQSITKISVEDVLQQTPQIGVFDQLPSYYGSPHVSPSKTRAIYILQSDAPPIPTRDESIEGGEQLSPSHALEMWLWENGTSYSLGVIKQCWLSDSFWSEDEQKVVLLEFGIPMPSCFDSTTSPQAWVLDLRDKTSTPIFSRPEYPPLQVYGFSPDGKYLLHGFFSYKTGANLALLDINALNSTPIDAPVNSFLQWIDNTMILITYRDHVEAPPYPVGILNLQTLQYCDLLPMFRGKYIRHVNISPDMQWITFAIEQQSGTLESLWLMQFDVDACYANQAINPP